MRRTEFREIVIKLLYAYSMNGDFSSDDNEKDVLNRFEGVVSHLSEIDEIIVKNLSRYTIDRLNIVDKAIIRNAVYEMVYTDLPANIAINEAINLTKKFSNLDDDQAKKFNNKLLDTIRKSLE